MIISRKVYDQEDKLVRIDFAEVYDGDGFYDKNDEYHMVSISDDGTSINTVLYGYAHDHHIEPMSVLTIMEHFRNKKIVRLKDALERKDFAHIEWRYYNAENKNWLRVMDWRYATGAAADGIIIFTDEGEQIEYPAHAPIKLV